MNDVIYKYIYLTPKTSFVPASSKSPKKKTPTWGSLKTPQKGHDPKMPCADLSICPMQPHRTQAQKLATEARDQMAALLFFYPSHEHWAAKSWYPKREDKGGILTYVSCM